MREAEQRKEKKAKALQTCICCWGNYPATETLVTEPTAKARIYCVSRQWKRNNVYKNDSEVENLTIYTEALDVEAPQLSLYRSPRLIRISCVSQATHLIVYCNDSLAWEASPDLAKTPCHQKDRPRADIIFKFYAGKARFHARWPVRNPRAPERPTTISKRVTKSYLTSIKWGVDPIRLMKTTSQWSWKRRIL
jgi:hypothetical protein